jgi:prevent-host-death family protein
VNVRELRQNLSVYLRRVKAGETLEVAERNQPVAVLAPLSTGPATLTTLAAQGRLARIADAPLSLVAKPAARAMRPSAEVLAEQRDDRI